MNLRSTVLCALGVAAVAGCADQSTAPRDDASRAAAASTSGTIGINVVLKTRPTQAQLATLGGYGSVFDVLPEIRGVIMRAKADRLSAIRALPFVSSAGPDQRVRIGPPGLEELTDFSGGLSTWNLDAINVTLGPGFDRRTVAYTGDGVYVGVLDTGLLPTWRNYFPTDRIAAQYATTFIGGGASDQGNTPSPPGKWERDQNSHGTHVVSTIIGYSLNGTPVDGVAPKATIIPVKVLNQNGGGWSSAIAEGIVYITRLKQGTLVEHPMVINMSLGGSELDPLEKAAIDAAVSAGVIVVAAAGNSGDAGMDYPGAYAPVISAAAAGWVGQWTSATWWFAMDVPDPTSASQFFIADFSGRQKSGQDLDVAAPGEWVVGPYQTNTGHLSYFFLSGTSMATPHVSGVVALMAQKDPALTASQAETTLEQTAAPLGTGCRTVLAAPGGPTQQECWGTDATGAGLVQADRAVAATP